VCILKTKPLWTHLKDSGARFGQKGWSKLFMNTFSLSFNFVWKFNYSHFVYISTAGVAHKSTGPMTKSHLLLKTILPLFSNLARNEFHTRTTICRRRLAGEALGRYNSLCILMKRGNKIWIEATRCRWMAMGVKKSFTSEHSAIKKSHESTTAQWVR